MIIHTVKEGETLFNIARKYSIPPTKLLDDNGHEGDRLVAGDELIVLIPTRTVSVRGGDTLASVASRFSVKEQLLLVNNPSLALQRRLRPGQILTVKQNCSCLGAASAVGIAKKGARRENLMKSLPFTTYLCAEAAILTTSGIGMKYDPTFVTDAARLERKISLIGISDESCGAFLDDTMLYGGILDKMITVAKKYGFGGIALDARLAAAERSDQFLDFLVFARKKLIGCDLILFTYVGSDSHRDVSELSDGAIYLSDGKSFPEASNNLRSFCESAESSKVFVSLFTSASIGENTIDIPTAKALCYKSGLRLVTDAESLLCSFSYTRYKSGKKEVLPVSFPSLKYTKSKLEHIAELGFGGIAFDIETTETARLCMFNSSFRRADYSLP